MESGCGLHFALWCSNLHLPRFRSHFYVILIFELLFFHFRACSAFKTFPKSLQPLTNNLQTNLHSQFYRKYIHLIPIAPSYRSVGKDKQYSKQPLQHEVIEFRCLRDGPTSVVCVPCRTCLKLRLCGSLSLCLHVSYL